jgi:hypothetical protein
MAEEMNGSKNPIEFESARNRARLSEAMAAARKQLGTTKPVDQAKKRLRVLDVLSAVGVFLLGLYLPRAYKVFAPFLFVIPVIITAVNKARLSSIKHGNPIQDKTNSPPMPPRIPSPEPYTEMPKDPKDPRRYKPIG